MRVPEPGDRELLLALRRAARGGRDARPTSERIGILLPNANALPVALLALWSLGKVPAIRHGDALVTEQVAITIYLADLFSPGGLAPALKEGKVDAIVTWEPFVTQTLTQVPDTYEVIRGGQHMSYVMVAVAHGPTVETQPGVIKSIAAGFKHTW